MKKNKLYILSSILITISICASALTCNLCGNPIEITIPEEETSEERPGPAIETAATTQTTPQNTGVAPEEDNQPPIIVEIEMDGYDIDFLESEGVLDEIPFISGEEPGEAIISIIATDEDGDELQYSAHDSQGTNFDVIKIDNNNAEFTFRPHFEAAPYTLTIEVSDGKGGIDSYPINMNFVENHHPVITRGVLIENLPGVDSPPGGPYVAGGIYYRISVEAVDPDGDPLTYYWSGGGENGFSDPGVNPTNWITPDTAGTFSIYVNAVDRKGGVAEARSEDLIVE